MDATLLASKAHDRERQRKLKALRKAGVPYGEAREVLQDDYLFFSAFEFFMDADLREATGAIYTPEWVVTLMVDRLLDTWQARHPPEALWDARVLDPACGSGNFPEVLTQRLVERLRLIFPNRSQSRVETHVLTEMLYAWDINAEALAICQQRLKDRWGIDPIHVCRQDNTLLEDPAPFDLIIGNPPYGDLLDAATKAAIGDAYGNIALNFIDWAVAHLKDDGECALIVPHSFTRVKSRYDRWRVHMQDGGHVAGVIDVGNPFWDITLEEVILFLNRRDNTTVWTESHKSPTVAHRVVPVNEFYNSRFDRKMMLHWDPFYHAMQEAGGTYPFGGRRGQDVSKSQLTEQAGPGTRWHILGKNIEKGQLRTISGYDRHIRTDQMKPSVTLTGPVVAITQFGTNLKAARLDTRHHPSGGVVVIRHEGLTQDEAIAYLNHPAANHYLKKFVFNDADLTVHIDGVYLHEIPYVGLDKLDELAHLIPAP